MSTTWRLRRRRPSRRRGRSSVPDRVGIRDGGRVVVLLLARGQPTDKDAAWFDDAAVYPLDEA